MLHVSDLTLRCGEAAVARGFCFDADEKGIYGILGASGAGKTAIARLICGAMRADGGEITINDLSMSPEAVELRKKVRCVPTQLILHSVTTAEEHLDLVGMSLGVSPDRRYRQIKEALELVGLSDARRRTFKKLSAAQRARLAIAASLLGNPDVIVIDDALSPLTPEEKQEIYPLLSMLGGIKTIVLLTSSPAEVRELCGSVTLLHDGRAVICGSVAEIERKVNATAQLYVTVRGDFESIIEAVSRVEGVVEARLYSEESDGSCVISVEHTPDELIKDRIFTALAEISAPMLSTKSVMLTLEDVFYSFASMEKGNKDKAKEEASK